MTKKSEQSPTPGQSAPASSVGGEFSRSRQGLPLLAAAFVLFLLIAAAWAYHAVRESLYDVASEALETILEADVEALTFWIETEKSSLQAWAKDPDLRRSVAALAGLAAQSPEPREALLGSPHLLEAKQALEPLAGDEDEPVSGVVDRDGVILAATQDEVLGLRLSPKGRELAARAIRGEAFVSKPHLEGEMLDDYDGGRHKAWMVVAAPVRDLAGDVGGVLLRRIRPEKDFTRILSVARVGNGGDTYAFDEQGVMLSNSRHDDQLTSLGLLPDTSEAGSILRLQLRDPGGDLTRGYKPKTPVAEQPLTRLVAAAVAAKQGKQIILEPYRDYRGVRVIGAYQWLSGYDMGVATEVELGEMLRILRPLRLAFSGLFGVVVAGAAALLIVSFFNQRLRRRVREVMQLGQYTLERKIGEGGMGKVYLARHAMLRRPTAVKYLDGDRLNPEAIARFEREVQLTSQLGHPNTVEVYDYGHTSDGIFYYAMEYLPGITLAHLIEMEGTVPTSRVIYILRQICSSLEEAHDAGLIHRDIKPLNVMLCQLWGQADVVKVLDFGLVKDIAEPEPLELTSAQLVPGTPAYVAPERLRDPLNIDARADIYCVGAVGFNLLTGRDVFEGNSAMDITVKVLQSPAPRLTDFAPGPVPAALDELIVACLAKDPADRPQTVREIIEALDGVQEVEPWDQDKASLWWREHAEEIEKRRERG
jgi:hypothetical protein